MEHITNTITQARGRLRRYARQAAKTGRATETAAWVEDNLPALKAALENALRPARRQPERFARLLGQWKALCPEGVLPEEEALVRGLAAAAPDLSDCALLAPAAGAYFACRAAESAVKELAGDTAAGPTACACVKSLLALKNVDFDALTAAVCPAEQLLAQDPSGDYGHMSDATKAQYRRAVIRGAKKAGQSEADFAREALARARAAETDRHVGFYLPLRKNRSKAAVCYLAAEALLCLALSAGAALWAGHILYAVMLWLPLSAALFPLCEAARARLFPAVPLCAMEEEREIGPENAVLAVVTGLLPPAGEAEALYEHLSRVYDAARGGSVRLMLLLDKKNAPAPVLPEDAADLAAVKRVIDRLNRDHGGGFAAAVRGREWAPTEEEYTGLERKRGAVIALMRFLRDGDGGAFEHLFGETEGLTATRYVMALDADTELSFGALRRLAAVACHPLNRAVCDPVARSVTRGYGCITPRGEVSLEAAGRTFFTRLFTEGGTLAYAPAVSERNMDLFGCSVFTGKGLIDVDAFNCAVGDRFRRGRILSHDALEGAMLRTAFAGDCEITESFPARPDSWYARLHRWVRGDAQNARYIFFPVTDTPVPTRLPAAARYHLWQNVKRAVTPAAALACLLAAPFAPARAAAVLYAAALLSATADSLLCALRGLPSGGVRSLLGRYCSSEMGFSLKCFLRAVVQAGSLPRQGLVCADALARSAVRSLFTHRHLLRWTTASQADGLSARPLFTGYLLPLAAGAVTGVFGGPFGRLLSVLILLATLLSLADGVPLRRSSRRVSERDRETVRSFMAAAWRYFADNVTAEEHFLPPDNVQETPVMRTARRTSPTNIGLYLTAAVAARDLGLIGEGELLDRLSATLKTVADLPKYRGCLYNWYDTATLSPLAPAYVSTVDCGNFLCCLTALQGALAEVGGERAAALNGLIASLRQTCDMGFLYDRRRDLFYIGYDARSGALSEARYDLLMSEARMTSFYETASRRVPAAHMRALGRMLLRSGGGTVAASWTGTLFEYFMPTLFLPVAEGSFVGESLRACLAAQKRRMGRLPWGVTESCFAAADHAGNYRYKAHGLAALSLKRLADDEPVVAPYASFLALPFDFRGAMKNLSAIAALHAQGACGFYEAVDFTPSRTGGEDYAIVRCWMAHHVGMSMVAAANALLDNVFVRRFMRDPAMRAGRSLLYEKAPAAPRVERGPRPRGPEPLSGDRFRSTGGEGENPFTEAAFYGGEWLLAADRYGRNRSVFASLEMYRYSGRCRGLTVSVRCGGKALALNAAAAARGTPGERAFTARGRLEQITAAMGLLAHPSQPALLAPVRVTNPSAEPVEAEVTFYFEPLLRPALREDDHPAFTDLFLRWRYRPSERTLTFARAHGAALCAGLYSRAEFRFETDREKLLPRDPYREAPVCFAAGRAEGTAVCPAAAVTVRFSLPPGKSAEQVLVLTCDFSENGAAERLERVRAARLPRLSEGAANPFARESLTAPFAAAFLRSAFFGSGAARREAARSLTADRGALWAVGISGDLPLLTLRTAACAESTLRAMARLHKRLAACGVANDLVLLTDAPGGYGEGERTAFDPLLREEDLLGDKGRPGGVYVLREGVLSPGTLSAVLAFSALVCPEEETDAVALPPPEKPRADPAEAFPRSTEPQLRPSTDDGILSAFSPGGFAVTRTPVLPWCHTLSNRTFGTLVSDGSLGFTWAGNSQLNRLTPWGNDVSTDNAGERLYLETGVRRYDTVWGARAVFTDAAARWESLCGPFRVTVTVAVPERGSKKRVILEAENRSGEPQALTVRYRLLPQLCRLRGDAAFVSCTVTEEGVVLRNPLNGDCPGAALLYGEGPCSHGVGTESDGAFLWPKAEVSADLVARPGERVQAVFGLCFAATEQAAVRLKRAPFIEKKPRWATVAAGDGAADRFGSALLLHQVRDTRLLARCGFYQCAGGYGFRDQLQDLLPLTKRDPALCRELLVKMAAAQFPEGDALHWFHPLFRDGKRLLRGVRTTCSDDRLWLPSVAARYVADTGDRDLLSVSVPFLAGEPLAPGEHSRCADYAAGGERASLYAHCLRCFDGVTTGRHGLPLLGGGDWNDGFDALGRRGKGESVWLAMFLRRAALDFARVCHILHDTPSRERLLRLAEEMAAACERYAWAGDRYLRAFADDGTPLGGGADPCHIDLLPQAWASLADLPDGQKRKAALGTAYRELFDEEHGIVKLLSPPFTAEGFRAGYINDYPAGVRENGGQYTHAAVWFLLALRKEGMETEAQKVLHALLPLNKYRTAEGYSLYRTEPYALAGDVYAAPGQQGRGGWSLYTGAAGWLLQYLAP